MCLNGNSPFRYLLDAILVNAKVAVTTNAVHAAAPIGNFSDRLLEHRDPLLRELASLIVHRMRGPGCFSV